MKTLLARTPATPAVTVYAAPPPPLVEYRGLPPAFGYVWLDGYWDWGRGRYDWVPGRWVSPPPGRFWVPRVWRRDGERWHSHGGHWESHRPPQRLAPPPTVEVPGYGEMKYDLRLFAYRGRILGVTARLYRGQVTNLRTEGGGFARVTLG